MGHPYGWPIFHLLAFWVMARTINMKSLVWPLIPDGELTKAAWASIMVSTLMRWWA